MESSDMHLSEQLAWVVWARAATLKTSEMPFHEAFRKAVVEIQPDQECCLWMARILFTCTLESVDDPTLKSSLRKFSLIN